MRPVGHQATASSSRCVLGTGWRWLLTASTILIGLVNPLLCVLHCALVLQHAPLAAPGEQRSRFYCDLPARIAAAYAPAPGEAVAGQARSAVRLFFGGAEGLLAGGGQLMPALALFAWGVAGRRLAPRFRAFPPPVPPPRLPRAVRVSP